MNYKNLILIITFSTFGIVIGQNQNGEKINPSYLYGNYSEVWELNKTEFDDRIILTKRLEHNGEYKGLVTMFHYHGGLKTGYSLNSKKNDGKTNPLFGTWKINQSNRTLTTTVSLGDFGKIFHILELSPDRLVLMKLNTE
ncbi:hypothetical protein CJ739_2535 [Mariniflexile rhizosphaerae]|uniref:hypothetical protein n=1 Tax=unclassified Mariniflexile TaxID=2643887 RepID=UPI000CC0F127|nr:hypothetical protein [Mariniflexile sp. TRM1-10]AXP81608.1 hypothetical protein CJ739_2535 [Mariniflexile sp. TRM1-10]PLB17604.1 MAG: hypothetical protein TRG1_3541 [Flavobacteriaceae bacterium FS1-H7996/R]